MPHFKISQDAAQAILDYLQTKPYREVFQIVPLLIGLEPLPEDAPRGEDAEVPEGEENPSEGEPVAEEATERAPDTEKTPRGKKDKKKQ